MKKASLIILALLLLPFSAAFAHAEDAELDEWTVLFYFCGSDLESKYGYATGNLEEITLTYHPDNFAALSLERQGLTPDEDLYKQPGKVNVLIETGGSVAWHTEDEDVALGMNVDTSTLQRWSYNTYSMFESRGDGLDGEDDDARVYGFELLQTLPLQSMADPGTLADFIRWGVLTRPAKKYALLLWDHGDGARSGLFIDELFDRDVMYLYELKQALADGGAHFETIIIDACLMANIETAWNIKDFADWLVASEETVPGEGTAVSDWLQQLRSYPDCGGEWLGRLVCDTTSIKYANEASQVAKSILTWSVIDLSKIDALIEVTGRFMQEMGDDLRENPTQASLYMHYLSKATIYGDGQQHMREFGSLVYNLDLAEFGRSSTRNAAIQALSDAVTYCVRGIGRSEARGLTFCYPAGLTDAELDIYAQNFPMPHYLAYIDAVSDWTAPDWVYENMPRLPEIDDIGEFRIRMQKQRCADGMLGFLLKSGGSEAYVNMVYYTLYRLNEETGETVRLGRTDCIMAASGNEDFELLWRASDPMHWPAVEGQLLCMDLVQSNYFTKLYNVPVMLDAEPCLLRLGRRLNYAVNEEDKINDYEIYGLWEGYEENSTLLRRSVKPLSSIMGQEYQLLYPIDGTGGASATLYESSAPLTMYRALDVQEIPLPAGTYYLEYAIEDEFMRLTVLERIEVQWDGENMTFPTGEAWENGEWIDLIELRRAVG